MSQSIEEEAFKRLSHEGRGWAFSPSDPGRPFLPCAWARHVQAKPGTFRLLPDQTHLTELRRDSRDMQQMIFQAAPDSDEIMTALQKLETAINQMAPTPAEGS